MSSTGRRERRHDDPFPLRELREGAGGRHRGLPLPPLLAGTRRAVGISPRLSLGNLRGGAGGPHGRRSGRAVFPSGNPPLVAPLRLRQKTGLSELWFKNDTLNMSGSLKDRASALVAEQAL